MERKQCPWGVTLIVLEKIQEIERIKKISKRCDELIAKNLEKRRRYYDGLTTPTPKEETKVRIYRMGEDKK
jgi:hypothetical protein|nr:MAG TPA: hypothetical protein [Caudoviricetes sp.]